jgi:hypothetical protein
MGVAGLGHGPLATWRAGGICRGEQAQELQPCSWACKTCQVTHCRHQGHGHGARDAAQGLQRLDHRGQTPGVDGLAACLRQPLEAVGGFLDGPDRVLKNHGWSGHGAAHCRAPPEVGRAPMSPACVTDVVPEQAGCEAQLGVFELAHGVVTCPGEIAQSLICDCGDRDRGKIPCAGQAGQWYGVSAVGLNPVPRFLGEQRGRHPPAIIAFVGQRPREPGATGAGVRDKDEGFGLRWHLADHRIDGTLAGAKAAEGGDRGARILGHRGDSDRVFVDLHADEACARLGQG